MPDKHVDADQEIVQKSILRKPRKPVTYRSARRTAWAKRKATDEKGYSKNSIALFAKRAKEMEALGQMAK